MNNPVTVHRHRAAPPPEANGHRPPGPAPRKGGRRADGFTLIELIVVIALISLMLSFALPRFSSDLFADDADAGSRRILLTVKTLKERAFLEQTTYILNIDVDDGRLWLSRPEMSDEEREAAAAQAYRLPAALRIVEVAYPRREPVSAGLADIWFFGTGVSEKALIRTETPGGRRDFVIEPFLPDVALIDTQHGVAQ